MPGQRRRETSGSSLGRKTEEQEPYVAPEGVAVQPRGESLEDRSLEAPGQGRQQSGEPSQAPGRLVAGVVEEQPRRGLYPALQKSTPHLQGGRCFFGQIEVHLAAPAGSTGRALHRRQRVEVGKGRMG